MVYSLDIQSFYEAFSLTLLIAVFLRIVITPLLLCVSRHLCLWQVTSQESVLMPSAWWSHLHTSLKRSWGRPVGLFPVAISPYKRSFGMQPSFIRVTTVSHYNMILTKTQMRHFKHTLDIWMRKRRTNLSNPGRSSAAAALTKLFCSKSTNCVFKNHMKLCSSAQDGFCTPQCLQ